MTSVLIIMNNYFHDVATAVLLASAVILWVLGRQAEQEGRGGACALASRVSDADEVRVGRASRGSLSAVSRARSSSPPTSGTRRSSKESCPRSSSSTR